MQGNKYDTIWQGVWTQVKTYDEVDPSQVDAFFSRLQLQAFSEGFAMLTADNSFIKTWIESHFFAVIKKALEEIYSTSFVIAIEVDESSSTPAPAPAPAPNRSHAPLADPSDTKSASIQADTAFTTPSEPKEESAKQSSSKEKLVSGYSFENFVRGTSNSMPYSMALAVAETPGKTELNPLFIYGKSGLGKTHLLRAIQNYIQDNHNNLRTVYVDAMELVNDYTDAAASGKNEAFSSFKNRYENADVLLIDDVQGLQNKNETLNIVFQILNKMIDSGRQVVLAADRAPKSIDIEERYQSRFNSGGTCNVQPPEFETKLGIISNYIKECNKSSGGSVDIPWEVREYIAQNSSSNIRELKSAVTKVIFEINSGRGIETTRDVESLLSNHFSGGAMHKPTVAGIQKVVEDYYRISHAELVGKRRSANIAAARQIAIYLCRTLIDIPLNSIGNEFNRDHTTVMHSMKVVEEKIKKDREINEELEILRRMIMEG